MATHMAESPVGHTESGPQTGGEQRSGGLPFKEPPRPHSSARNCFRRWGTPQVDLSAMEANHRLPTWFSSRCHVPVLDGLKVYTFLPIT